MADPTNLGVYHIAANPEMYEVARENNFRFIVQGLDNLLRVGGDPTDRADYLSNAQEVIDFSVVRFTPPHFSQDDIAIKRGNSTTYYASTPTFNAQDLVVNDYIGADSKSILEAWQALSYDVVNDTIQNASNYKKDAYVLEYTPAGKLVKYWEVKGCWVKGLNEDGYNAESSGKKTVTANIRYDRAIPHTDIETLSF